MNDFLCQGRFFKCWCFMLTIVLMLIVSMPSQAKHYSRKAPRPAASDHTWSDYDYSFNYDEYGLSGTNTFSLVYNSTPPRWYNDGYAMYRKLCYTGSETLTIIVEPGDFNYTYKITTAVTEWEWDTHILKWVKKRNMPYNGTRIIKIKDGVIEGPFSFPVYTNSFWGVYEIFGKSVNGIVPDKDKIGWKYYETGKKPEVLNQEIKSVGDSVRLNVENYVTDVLKIEDRINATEFKSSETGSYTPLRFPVSKVPMEFVNILRACGDLAGIGSALEYYYAYFTLPDVYYDAYVSPFDPIESILPNGHKLVKQLQPNGIYDTVESWNENGFDYIQKNISGAAGKVIGQKYSGDTTYVNLKDSPDNKDIRETGFLFNGKYTPLKIDNASFDWSNILDGYYKIIDSGDIFFCWLKDDSTAIFKHPLKSELYNREYGKHVFKIVHGDNSYTVAVSDTSNLSPQAMRFLREREHPLLLEDFKKQVCQMQPKRYLPPTPLAITIDSKGNVKKLECVTRNLKGAEKVKYEELDARWNGYFNTQFKNNRLQKLKSDIGMELDVPDYVVTKIDKKIIGERTTKLLKKLIDLLNKKNGKDKDNVWPNNVKKEFLSGNKYNDYKKVEINEISKEGSNIEICITKVDANGTKSGIVLRLEDNLPSDKYGLMWEYLVQEVK